MISAQITTGLGLFSHPDTHRLRLSRSLFPIFTFLLCLFAQPLFSLPCQFWVWHRFERQICTSAWIEISTIPVTQEAGSQKNVLLILSQSNKVTTDLSKLVNFLKKNASYELVLSPCSTSVSKWTKGLSLDRRYRKPTWPCIRGDIWTFPNAWCGQTRPTARCPLSPNLTAADLFLWIFIKDRWYWSSLNCLKHLW
jgi:hypothetical protein